ncbi:MAG: hypothetical protein ACYC0C_08440 [Devosia sp.]
MIQGIEYDIVAHSEDVRNLPNVFLRAVIENALITEHLGRKPLEGIKAAPQRFRDMFERAQVEMRPTKAASHKRHSPDVAVRLAAEMA